MDNNLDRLCFVRGTEIPLSDSKKNKIVIQKAMGVLQEDGIFAFYIYLMSLESKSDESRVSLAIQSKIEELLRDEMVNLLRKLNSQEKIKELENEGCRFICGESLVESKREIIEQLKEKNIQKNTKTQLNGKKNKINSFMVKEILTLAGDINALLLARMLIEKTLIYAMYQAKSVSD
ncbi:MAG: hypothetical protein WBA22_00405 [Candidatus Methanofastidiosia archaeon]